ncbi:MAG TPA: alkaline phosphatase PhoX [Steroidobacteraceae bacterium]|nr:alkaline phosphatase PhoX [Steroidobacteraceae bacterium]
MRDTLAAKAARHGLLYAVLAFGLAACGGGGGGGGSGGDDDGGGGDGGGGGGGGGGTSELPTSTSSSQTAYITSTATGWQVVPLVTVGDTPPGSSYAMAGKPDGLGAFAGRVSETGEVVDTGDYFTVLMNHELRDEQGVARAHGTKGAYVSQWTFELDTLRVHSARDLATHVYTYTDGAWADSTGAVTFDRLCSADLAPTSAYFNSATGRGYEGRIFTNGEEVDDSGRAFAWIVGGAEHGRAYHLPHLGRLTFENVVANPASGDATIVVGLDDIREGQVYVYVGRKSSEGNPVERAGLHGGKLYGVRVTSGGANYGSGAVPLEDAGAIEGAFELVDVSDVATGLGSELQSASVARGITQFARPEDGAWDGADARVFYWVTTGASVNGSMQTARLYRLTFDSLDNPTGGTIELVVDSAELRGTDGLTADGFDNITVAGDGHVIVQEDGGSGDGYLSKIWRIDPSTGTATQIFESDRSRFLAGGASFLTSDEENSGVIEVTDVVRNASWYDSGRRYYLGTSQAHYPHETASLVEGGQLYLFASPD